MHASSRHATRSAQTRGRGPGSAAGAADQLAGLLAPVVTAQGMDLEDIRVSAAGRRRLLRVVVDADGGVSLDDIAVVSRELSAALDAADAMGAAPYTLEVSSPGVDRPLTQPRHWRRNIGRRVVAPLVAGSAGPAGSAASAGEVLEGRIVAADEHVVTVDVAGHRSEYGYEELGPGKIVIEFGHLSDIPAEGDAGAAEEEPDGY
jgi:ribosome maturation factor RimP